MPEKIGVKPEWLKRTWRASSGMKEVEALVRELGLNTVCREASCPNLSECFERGTATFMILGANCTRGCGFCGVSKNAPSPPDADEPARVGEAAARLGLDYIVITSVTRDDLPDGGAGRFADAVREIRGRLPLAKIETLIPDFGGLEAALDEVIDAAPDVISHNMETVRELYGTVRPQADYARSLDVLRRIAEAGAAGSGIKCKSGFMLGLGETEAQTIRLMDDLREAGCEFLTIGQYLRPSAENLPVAEYVHPEVFEKLAALAEEKGFSFVASAPFVRSSYRAEEALI